METVFTPVTGLLGGMLIGLAAVMLMLANGRIAGVSGIVAGLIRPVRGDTAWRLAFVGGLWLGAALYWGIRGALFDVAFSTSLPAIIAAGVLVGYGTRMGSGCTSGHGICGISRFSKRSLIATAVFMGTAMFTVFVVRHVLR